MAELPNHSHITISNTSGVPMPTSWNGVQVVTDPALPLNTILITGPPSPGERRREPESGEVFIFNGEEWVPAPPSAEELKRRKEEEEEALRLIREAMQRQQARRLAQEQD